MNRFGKDNDSDHKTTVFRKKMFFWLWHRPIDADVKFENVRVRFLFLIVRVIMNRFIVL